MGAPLRQDAAFRWTEDGQDAMHLLGAKLRRPAPAFAQEVHSFQSADLTTIRTIAIGSGVEELRARISFDGMPWQLQSLLAAGRRGATLEYFPSMANPSESYPCRLIGHGEIEPDADFWWDRRYAADVHLRRTDGGSWRGITEGSFFYFRGGNIAPGLVFTRTGVAPYVDEDGVIQSAADGIWRTQWFDLDGDGIQDTPALLLEPARTNLVDEDDLTAWSTVGTPVVTGSIDDPAGGTSAFTVEDDDAGAVEYIERVVTFTGDADKSVVFVVRENTMPASGVQQLLLRDTSAPADRFHVNITGWTDGEPQITEVSGTYLGSLPIGDGWWAIYGTALGVVAANSNRLRIIAAASAGETGSIDVYRVNAFDAEIPSVSILDESDVRNADTWYASYDSNLRQKTIYFRFVELGAALGPDTFLLKIGDGSSGGDPSLYIWYNDSNAPGRYAASVDLGSSAASRVIASGDAASFGDDVELLVVIDPDGDGTGSLEISIARNGGAPSAALSAAGAALPPDRLLAGQRIYLGSNSGSNPGAVAVRDVKIFDGVVDFVYARGA